jgi:hypothetical protein
MAADTAAIPRGRADALLIGESKNRAKMGTP